LWDVGPTKTNDMPARNINAITKRLKRKGCPILNEFGPIV